MRRRILPIGTVPYLSLPDNAFGDSYKGPPAGVGAVFVAINQLAIEVAYESGLHADQMPC